MKRLIGLLMLFSSIVIASCKHSPPQKWHGVDTDRKQSSKDPL